VKARAAPVIIGRYAIHERLAAGGMASVHVGRLLAEKGFSRTVAIKRLHPQYALDPEFVGMFLDEARLAARVRHPNVAQTIDVVVDEDEVFLVMDYIEGDSLAHLLRATATKERIPPAHAVALMSPVLRGLHAAHEAKNDQGEPLGIVHRDVSPQNILIGTDGIPRILDFGVAKALGQSHTTQDGQIKGKLAYMSPEQIRGVGVDRRTDIFAASVVLWETLTGRRLFKGDGDANVIHLVLTQPIPPPSSVYPDLPEELDTVVLTGLARAIHGRYGTAEEMADALEEALAPTPAHKLSAWVKTIFGDTLESRAALVRDIESAPTGRSRPAATYDVDETIAVEWGATALTQSSPDHRAPNDRPSGDLMAETSQQSSIALEASPHSFGRGSGRKSNRAWIAGGAAVAVVAVGVLLLARGGGVPAPAATAGSTPALGAPPPAEPPPAPPPEPPPQAAETSAAATPEAAPSASAPAAEAPRSPPPAVPQRQVRRSYAPPAAPPPAAAAPANKLYGRY
jgi:serine/threonine protein kinase